MTQKRFFREGTRIPLLRERAHPHLRIARPNRRYAVFQYDGLRPALNRTTWITIPNVPWENGRLLNEFLEKIN